jgi:hypothetical protein
MCGYFHPAGNQFSSAFSMRLTLIDAVDSIVFQ